MNSLPRIKDEKKINIQIQADGNVPQTSEKKKPVYDYFSMRISKSTIESILKLEKDDRFIYFLKYGILRRFEGDAEIIFVEIPQIPKKIVVYRRPSYRQKTYDRLYLNSLDLPHIPLFEGEENLKLLSLENNLINKIDHLVSLNNLLYLNLYANKISEVENLQTVPKLRALMLGKNLIEKIKNLNWLIDLEVLDLHSNKIKIIENLSNLKKLRLLNLANNQITTFGELIANKNLEEINLRKNLIVTIPNQLYILEKIKKLNLGKNMISKIDNLSELKKAKTLSELIIEDNPVLVLRESHEIIKTLPLKNKTHKDSNGSVVSALQKDSSNGLKLKVKDSPLKMSKKDDNPNFSNFNTELNTISSPKLKKLNSSKTNHLPEINTNDHTNDQKDDYRNDHHFPSLNSNFTFKSEEISQTQSSNIISHIEKEWTNEFSYITENGYNGYNTKRLKESKIISGHAELEGSNKLNIFGNALEVLDREEFYNVVVILHFEFFNIDLITNRLIIDKIKNFKCLRKLVFSNNNIHSFYQLIKFEDLCDLEAISIFNNEICEASFLKLFLIYRFQNLKFYNDTEISQKDIVAAKKMFEHFDRCISHHESKEVNQTHKEKENNFNDPKALCNLNKKQEFCNFAQENLIELLEEIIDETIL